METIYGFLIGFAAHMPPCSVPAGLLGAYLAALPGFRPQKKSFAWLRASLDLSRDTSPLLGKRTLLLTRLLGIALCLFSAYTATAHDHIRYLLAYGSYTTADNPPAWLIAVAIPLSMALIVPAVYAFSRDDWFAKLVFSLAFVSGLGIVIDTATTHAWFGNDGLNAFSGASWLGTLVCAGLCIGAFIKDRRQYKRHCDLQTRLASTDA